MDMRTFLRWRRDPPDRLLARKKFRPGWPLLMLLLLGVNVYLFFLRSTPWSEKSQAPQAKASGRVGSNQEQFKSELGEMSGVAGVRSANTDPALPAQHQSAYRFDLAEAQGVSGQRLLEQWCQKVSGNIERGESFSEALYRQGVEGNTVAALVSALRGVFNFKHCRQGDQFVILTAPNGLLQRFTYRPSRLLSYQVERQGKELVGKKVEERAEVEVTPIAIRINGSLYASLEAAGESASLVMLIVDIFAWDIDFYTDTRRGDTIRLLVEKNRLNGEFVSYGRILAAEYRGGVGLRQAFWYRTEKDQVGYYNEEGGSLRKAFLKSPLKFVHITSGFGVRVHPILGYSGMHAGIDLAAPMGTPIWAPADGSVVSAGYQGGNGNLVVLHHANGFETLFAHLSSISREVRAGARVSQKQVIGYVGSTGMSTGSHLHYAMRRHGALINPFKQQFPPAEPVPKDELPKYQQAVQPWRERLQAIPLPDFVQTALAGVEDKSSG